MTYVVFSFNIHMQKKKKEEEEEKRYNLLFIEKFGKKLIN